MSESSVSSDEVAEPEGIAQESQPSVGAPTGTNSFAYRVVIIAISSIVIAYVVLVLTFAFLGILVGSSVLYVWGALILLFAMVSLLAVAYFRAERSARPERTLEIPDKNLRACADRRVANVTISRGVAV